LVPPRKPVILGVFLHQGERAVVEDHLHEHVAGEELARSGAALALDQLHHALGGHQHLAEELGEVVVADALEQRELGLVLVPRVGVHDVPLHLRGERRRRPARRRRRPGSTSDQP
jgi:hypothetical protein